MPGDRFRTTASTRPEFWQATFVASVERELLLGTNWHSATLWERGLRKPWQVEVAADLPSAWLRRGAILPPHIAKRSREAGLEQNHQPREVS